MWRLLIREHSNLQAEKERDREDTELKKFKERYQRKEAEFQVCICEISQLSPDVYP